MLDIKFIRENYQEVEKNSKLRNSKIDIKKILELDEKLRKSVQKGDVLRQERNQIAQQLKQSRGQDKNLVLQGKTVKEKLTVLEKEEKTKREELDELLLKIPNLTHPDAPVGKDDSENVEIRRFLEPTKFNFSPKDHVTLGKELDILDFAHGATVAGNGFYYWKNGGALLELALTQYAFAKCLAEGFEPMLTPDLARKEILNCTGYNPRGPETQIYSIENSDLSLIATAEITAAGYYQNHFFKKGELDQPKKIVALSHCFRTESGSYVRESHGLYRIHQFTKVEMFIYAKPEDSASMHEYLVKMEEKIMQGLKIPYRVVDICTGDLGGPAYRKYDLEAWMPFKNNWGEITSTSNCTDYQARRLNIKYQDDKNQKKYVHMLNGTAIAMSRTPLAVLENYQQADGSINVPEVLKPYFFGKTKI